MEYENPQVPDDVNLPKSHPLADFAWMLAAVAGTTAALVLALVVLADFLVDYVPFSMEQRLAESVELLEIYTEPPSHPLAESQTPKAYLQSLADKLIQTNPLPQGMEVTVHYQNDETVNAFATLGGHIFIHQGLIEKLESENALAMVMAHEIEHIRARHPIRATGRHIIVSLALLSITGFSQSSAIDTLAGSIGLVATLSFSRAHESQADTAALKTLRDYYGHVQGADQLFEVFSSETGSDKYTAFLSTHPLSSERIESVQQSMRTMNDVVQANEYRLVPLPAMLLSEK